MFITKLTKKIWLRNAYLASFNEFMVLYICLHSTATFNKMVIPTIHFKLSPRPCRMWDARAKSIRIFRNQFIVDAIFKRS